MNFNSKKILLTGSHGELGSQIIKSKLFDDLLTPSTNQILLIWENYLSEYLADRKLQNLFNNSASVSNKEVLNDYKKNNLSCNIDYLSINYNNIEDSLINILDDELLEIYRRDKDEKYMIDEKVTLEYILWENINVWFRFFAERARCTFT